jgi:3-deoxy-D-manno-octulosonate 8-phosphate phosphatase KdsC-like HAD superfamily phosphatase
MTREAGVEGLMANSGALPEMAKLLAIPLDEILVIDDGDNDIAMFERSGLSIFMGNASPEVWRGANVVTGSNGEDGFANAVERFNLGGRSNAYDGIARAGVPAW